MNYYLIITALTVSIDSFVCGFSLSLGKGKKTLIVTTIATTVLIMCLFANYLAKALSGVLSEKTASLGGLLLVAVGIYNLLKKEEKTLIQKGTFKQILLIGFAVGLDGAFANLSLSLMGINEIYVPITIAIFHALTIWLGILLADLPIAKKIENYTFIAPIILIALGLYKVVGIFI